MMSGKHSKEDAQAYEGICHASHKFLPSFNPQLFVHFSSYGRCHRQSVFLQSNLKKWVFKEWLVYVEHLAEIHNLNILQLTASVPLVIDEVT